MQLDESTSQVLLNQRVSHGEAGTGRPSTRGKCYNQRFVFGCLWCADFAQTSGVKQGVVTPAAEGLCTCQDCAMPICLHMPFLSWLVYLTCRFVPDQCLVSSVWPQNLVLFMLVVVMEQEGVLFRMESPAAGEAAM